MDQKPRSGSFSPQVHTVSDSFQACKLLKAYMENLCRYRDIIVHLESHWAIICSYFA